MGMKNYQQLWHSLVPLYEEGEAQALVRTILEVNFGLTLTDIVCGGVEALPSDKREHLEYLVGRLQQAEPVQYVLGQADFAGRAFHVEPGVLIPRPETAELCRWIAAEHPQAKDILDVCTGSGCIAITLALDILGSKVTGWDISETALRVAQKNAVENLVESVRIEKQDALSLPVHTDQWDVIVSNPPYVCEKEKADMEKNVLEYEPSIALFVPDDDPLRFYRAIAIYAVTALKNKGSLYFEINPLYEEEMRKMLQDLGFGDIKTKEDSFGKKRMMRAVK